MTMIDNKHFKNREEKVIERKVKIAFVHDASDYGFKEGDWVNSKVYFAVLKEMKKEWKNIPTFQGQAEFEDGKLIKYRKYGHQDWEEVE